MRNHQLIIALLLISFIFSANKALTQEKSDKKPVTISEKTKDMQAYNGYFNFYWDANTGKIWLEIDKLDTEFLYVNSLPAGVGSNDIGLDRSQLGSDRVVKFMRSGPKIFTGATEL